MTQGKLTRQKSVKVFDVLFNTSTIHGIKYIADLHSPRATRTFWIFAFLLSILGCCYYASQVYEKWYITPDIGLKTNYKSARSVPFPAITVCPQNKIKRSFLNFTAAYTSACAGNFTGTLEERRNFEMMLPLCGLKAVTAINDTSFKNYAALKGKDIVEVMNRTQYQFDDVMLNIRFRSSFDWGADKFLTKEGFCVSFNLLDYKDIFNEGVLSKDFDYFKHTNDSSSYDAFDGYTTKEKDAYPYRIFSGSENSLVLLFVHYKGDEDAACTGPDVGFRIYWHMPHEIPMQFHRSIFLRPDNTDEIIMKATRVTTSKDLERYAADKRRCYFEGENKLKFFKNYTKANCDMECLTEFTLHRCGCVRFFMPRNESTPVCDITQFECAENASSVWLEEDDFYMENKMPCNCYPSCAEIKYEVVMNDKNPFDARDTLAAFQDSEEFQNEYPGGSITRLKVVFEDFLIEDQENYLGYKMQHFISDCGGLLGLFMGCSILSLVELVYHIVLTAFFKSSEPSFNDDANRKPLTPMRDNRVVIADDVDAIKSE